MPTVVDQLVAAVELGSVPQTPPRADPGPVGHIPMGSGDRDASITQESHVCTLRCTNSARLLY